MSASPGTLEAVTEELRRLRRLAFAVSFVAALSAAVAVAALVAPYNAKLRANIERVLVAKGSPHPSVLVVEAERFVVRDQAGQVRAELGVDQDDHEGLTLRDPDGTRRAVIEATGLGAELGLFDQSGRQLVHMEVNDEAAVNAVSRSNTGFTLAHAAVGLSYIRPSDKSALTGVDLTTGSDGGDLIVEGPDGKSISLSAVGEKGSGPILTMNDAPGKTRVSLAITDDAPALQLFDKNEKLRGALGSYRGLEGVALSLYDKDEKLRAALCSYSGREDVVNLSLWDKDKKIRAALGTVGLETIKTGATEQTAESSLVLFDKKGKAIFVAPPP